MHRRQLSLLLMFFVSLAAPCAASARPRAPHRSQGVSPSVDPTEDSVLGEAMGPGTLGSFADPLGPLPAYVVRTVRPAKRARHPGGSPLIEEGTEEELTIFCNNTRFRLSSTSFTAMNQVRTVTTELTAGGPESITAIAVTPGEYNLKENNCRINYTMVGQTCANTKVEFTGVPNGTHPGNIRVTFGSGVNRDFDEVLID
jgi:hypothetical protein